MVAALLQRSKRDADAPLREQCGEWRSEAAPRLLVSLQDASLVTVAGAAIGAPVSHRSLSLDTFATTATKACSTSSRDALVSRSGTQASRTQETAAPHRSTQERRLRSSRSKSVFTGLRRARKRQRIILEVAPAIL